MPSSPTTTILSDQPPPAQTIRFCTTCLAVYASEFVRCPLDGGPLELSATDPLIGTQVAHYEIEEYLGGGAMGRVYRCRHTHLRHKELALKVLRGDLATTLAMRLRFTQEAEAASQLVHPNVVSVVDFGRTDSGLLYIAMELVQGEPLSAIIARGALGTQRTIALARQICDGLAHAHAQGFVHRDLKPDNILVVKRDGIEVPRIADFGLAIPMDRNADAARLTTAGALVGTPVYAAPEQMANRDEIDHRADLFALGVTMFEMLAGRVPFDAEMVETIHLNAAGERPTIASRGAHPVPARLEALVQRLMAASIDERPASTREVMVELDAIEHELLGVGQASTPKLASSPSRRRRTVVAGVAVLVLGLSAVWFAVRDPARSAPAPRSAAAPATATTAPPAAGSSVGPAAAPPPDITPVPAPPVDVSPPARVASSHRTRKAAGPRLARVATAPAPAPDAATSAPAVPPPTEVVAPRSSSSEVAAPSHDSTPPPSGTGSTPAVTGQAVQHPRPAPAPISDARVDVEALSVRGALTAAHVRRALSRALPQVRACYVTAAVAAHSAPPTSLQISLVIDESQRARTIRVSDGALRGLGACVGQALAAVRSETAPDVGVVDVAFVARFTPEAR